MPGILGAAVDAGADAVHPGYGFLSESAVFASAVEDSGRVWVGPPPSVIEVMGDKIAAKRLALENGVPTLPLSEDPGAASHLHYPLLVKAAAGGGGKGMRIVTSSGDLSEALAGARREAAASFGDDRVFLERYVEHARHVEIQVLGDAHGALVHLGERECSVQRRHQKIIEESPSPALDPPLRKAMADAALRLAESVGYRSLGTVEFLVDEATREFFFLEMNTRLQVEHAVTEMTTGIDLVREQLRVAAGEPLGYDQDDISPSGHAIEVRLYAEDPDAGFLPAAGTLAAFVPPEFPSVRWDSGVESGSVVGVEFDPMLAKVVAHAPTRGEAVGTLALALQRLHVGGVTTNRDFLVAVLHSPAFGAGETTTDFIERNQLPGDLELNEGETDRALAAAALWLRGRNRAEAAVLSQITGGWSNGRLPAPRVTLERGGERFEVEYRQSRDGSFLVGRRGHDAPQVARVHAWRPGAIDLELSGRRSVYAVTLADDRLYVQLPCGTVGLSIVPMFRAPGPEQPEGALVAPMPGVVTDVRVEAGGRVVAGEIMAVLEAMKMEHHIRAPASGVVTEVLVERGEQVTMAMALLVLSPDGPGGDTEGSQ